VPPCERPVKKAGDGSCRTAGTGAVPQALRLVDIITDKNSIFRSEAAAFPNQMWPKVKRDVGIDVLLIDFVLVKYFGPVAKLDEVRLRP
jgi:N-glycosylase/DNA lyase